MTGPMVTAAGTRIGWGDVPEHVREEIARIVGSPIVTTESQRGGFSPGAAERLVGSDGRRAFVKAANAALNEFTPGLYRRELAITAALPASAPATTLLGSYDDGDWVALVLADVEGRHPLTPWRSGEITAVLRMLQNLAEHLTPVPDGLVVPRAEDELRADFLRLRQPRRPAVGRPAGAGGRPPRRPPGPRGRRRCRLPRRESGPPRRAGGQHARAARRFGRPARLAVGVPRGGSGSIRSRSS